LDQIADPDRHRPDHCPQCEAKRALTGHGFYHRTLVDVTFNGVIRVRRYLCCSCKRTVSLLPEFVLPWLRFSISVIALFLAARLAQRSHAGSRRAGGRANRHATRTLALHQDRLSKIAHYRRRSFNPLTLLKKLSPSLERGKRVVT
jgi:hypothetical protein